MHHAETSSPPPGTGQSPALNHHEPSRDNSSNITRRAETNLQPSRSMRASALHHHEPCRDLLSTPWPVRDELKPSWIMQGPASITMNPMKARPLNYHEHYRDQLSTAMNKARALNRYEPYRNQLSTTEIMPYPNHEETIFQTPWTKQINHLSTNENQAETSVDISLLLISACWYLTVTGVARAAISSWQHQRIPHVVLGKQNLRC
jgi:hypothetical protein